MKLSRLIQGTVAVLTLCGMLIPAPILSAATPGAAPQLAAGQVADVELGARGTLQGQLLDGQGNAKANEVVALRGDNGQVVTTRTDQRGGFVFAGLRGGTYQCASGDSVAVCRVWSARTAPPQAKPGVLLIAGDQVVRGGLSGGGWRTAAAIVGIAALGYAVYEIVDDDSGS